MVSSVSSSPLRGASASQWAYRTLILALIIAIVVVPLWAVRIPPMLDYHNHLARQYILANLPDSPYLQRYYFANWSASPYLAIEIVVQTLAGFVPIEIAGKLFLTFMLLLLALAPLTLNWALYGRVTPIALFGLLFVHNYTVTLGFVSYLFSVGLSLCLLGLWIRLRASGPWIKLGVFPVLSSALFFSHLIGYALYGIMASAYFLGQHIAGARQHGWRGFCRFSRHQHLSLGSLALQLVVPLSIFILFGPSTETTSSNTHGGLVRKLELLAAMFSYLLPAYNWSIDKPLAIVFPIALLLLLLLRKIEIASAMLWPLGALLAIFLVMPMELFSGWGADHRLIPVLGLALVGSLRLRLDSRFAGRAVVGLAVLLILLRSIGVVGEWRRADAVYEEYVRAFDSLTKGSKVYFAFGHEAGKKLWPHPAYHVPTLAVIRKDVFMPYLFSGTVSPLYYTPEANALELLSKGQDLLHRESPNWNSIVDRYDFFLLVDERYFDNPPPASLQRVFVGNHVTVYRRPGHVVQ